MVAKEDNSESEKQCCPEELVESNKIILRRIGICLIIFYAIYYLVIALLNGIFHLNTFDGTEPFNFVTMSQLNFTTGSKESIVSFLALELTYFLTTLVISFFLLSRIWDYAITLVLFHLLLSSAVMRQFPISWQWWSSTGIALLWMIIMGEIIAFFLRQKNARRIINRSLNFPESGNGKA